MDCITLTVLQCAAKRTLSCKINDCHVYTYFIYPSVLLVSNAPFSSTPTYHQQCIVKCCKHHLVILCVMNARTNLI